MKYILEKDLINIFRNNKKIIISFLIMLILYAMFITIINDFDITKMTYDIFYSNIGGNHNITSVYEYIMLMLNVAIYIFVVIEIITRDLSYGREYIFMRMTQKKWVIQKIISIIIIASILSLIANVILFGYYSLIGIQFKPELFINIVIMSMLSKLNLSLLILLFYQAFNKLGNFLIVFTYSYSYINYNSFNVESLLILKILFPSNGNVLLSVLISVVLILFCITFSVKSYTKFERC